uniref:Uncharacterized protein n=1 Tax=viral metagenome TaxID=1070528 RepID=A0A6C0FBA8_9ZZZZ
MLSNIVILYLLKYSIIAITLLTQTKMTLKKATTISYIIFIPFILIAPYLIINSKFYWLLLPGAMLFFSILSILLNFLSIYEDKSRFSEVTGYDPKTKEISTLNVNNEQVDRYGNLTSRKPAHCIVQMYFPFLPDRWVTLRKNALITGIISHVMGSLALYMAGISFIESKKSMKNTFGWKLFAATICVLGTYGIYNLTKDGGPSDLRKKENKCAYNRIMADSNRTIVNFIVSFVAIIVSWQGLINLVPKGKNLDDLKKIWIIFLPLYILKYSIFNLQGILLIITSALDARTNQLNLVGQLAPGTSQELDLPPCFN